MDLGTGYDRVNYSLHGDVISSTDIAIYSELGSKTHVSITDTGYVWGYRHGIFLYDLTGQSEMEMTSSMPFSDILAAIFTRAKAMTRCVLVWIRFSEPLAVVQAMIPISSKAA